MYVCMYVGARFSVKRRDFKLGDGDGRVTEEPKPMKPRVQKFGGFPEPYTQQWVISFGQRALCNVPSALVPLSTRRG